jgi:hypothetical protein
MPRFEEALPRPEDVNGAGKSASSRAARGSRSPEDWQEIVPTGFQQEATNILAPGVTPFGGLPVAATGAEFFDAVAIFENESGDFYDPRDAFSNYNNMASDPVEAAGTPLAQYRYPAPLSVVPTSTTNAARPRTVAAGYDRRRLVLTVVFRDGTYYNYYEVPAWMWQSFKQRVSKGRYIAQVLDGQPRGPADVAQMDAYARETLSRLSRTNQIVNKDQRGVYRTDNQHRRNATQKQYKAGKKKI